MTKAQMMRTKSDSMNPTFSTHSNRPVPPSFSSREFCKDGNIYLVSTDDEDEDDEDEVRLHEPDLFNPPLTFRLLPLALYASVVF